MRSSGNDHHPAVVGDAKFGALKKVAGLGIALYLLLLVVGYVAFGSVPSVFEGFIALLTISTYAAVVSGKRVQAPNIWFPKFEVPKSVSKLLKRPKNKG